MEGLTNLLTKHNSVIQRSFLKFKQSSKDIFTCDYIEAKQELLEREWSLYNITYDKLYELYAAQIDEPKMSELYDSTEDTYLTFKCLLKSLAQKETSSTEYKTSSFVNLPKINIPIFSGKYEEWTTFKELFVSLIHNNKTLGNVQKLHYLKSHLTGEAEQLVRHTPITDANYIQCWSKLEARYSNKRYLVNCCLTRLVNQGRMQVESASTLKDLFDTTNDCLNYLKNLEVNVDTWDTIVIHLVTAKLDPETRKQWELHVSGLEVDSLPTFAQFSTFIEHRFRALECIEHSVKSSTSNQANHSTPNISPKIMLVRSSKLHCEYCNDYHKLCFCKEFAKQTVQERRKFVLNHQICWNCLGGNHTHVTCKNPSTCKICHQSHHSLLHLNKDVDTEKLVCSSPDTVPKQVLLPTAKVKAQSSSGVCQPIRALLDQGSEACFITEASVQDLNLKKVPIRGHEVSLLGGNRKLISQHIVHLNVQSRTNPNVFLKIDAYVLDRITSQVPEQVVNNIDWVSNLALADSEFGTPQKIDLLLGAEVYCRILKEGIIHSPSGAMIAQNTTLGWVLSGVVDYSRNGIRAN